MHLPINAMRDPSIMPHGHNTAAGQDKRRSLSNDEHLAYVSNILLQLGIPVNVKGYGYLREAIIIKLKDPHTEMPVTKILYPAVAKKFCTSTIRVERAIRHSIEAAWNKRDQSSWDSFFMYPFAHLKKRPTNSEFIAMIVECILLHTVAV